MTVQRVVLFGAGGYGRWHLENILRLQRIGRVELAGVDDPRPPDSATRELVADVLWDSDPAHVLAVTRPDVVVVATPIHTHSELAELAVRSGADVLLEKPPVPGTAEFDALDALLTRTGRSCQVGFQSLSSDAVPALRAAILAGELGTVTGVAVAGAWSRTPEYYRRADWAGRRTLHGRPVLDGALTNPFAHAVVTALAVAGVAPDAAPGPIELELYRANPIEADDTACVRFRPPGGPPVLLAATLCAPPLDGRKPEPPWAGTEQREPYLMVHGGRANAVLHYTQDTVTIGDAAPVHYGRTDLLENLLAHRENPAANPVLVPLARTRAFTEFVQAVRDAPDPLPIVEPYREHGPAGDVRIGGVVQLVRRSAEEVRLFSELGVDWARYPSYRSAP